MSNKIVKNNKVETIKLVVKPINLVVKPINSTPRTRVTNHVYEAAATTVVNPYTSVLKDIFKKIVSNKVNIAVIAAIVVVASGVKNSTATTVTEVKSLCDAPVGQVVKASGRVVSIKDGLSHRDTTITLEESGSNCTLNVNVNESRNTIGVKAGDFLAVNGEVTAFGVNAKSYDINPSSQAETIISVMRLHIQPNELRPTYNNQFELSLAAAGGGKMIIPANLAGRLIPGLHEYEITYTNKGGVYEASDITMPSFIR